jgi:hypothetical protein
MKKFIAVIIVVSLAGCVTVPSDALVVTPELLQRRQLETRQYMGIKEADILAASANVLQDMGFNIEESETKLGVITANKERGGASAGEIVAKVIVAVFTGVSIPWNKDQKIRVSLVVRPSLQSKAGDEYLVRVTFQRIVKQSNGAISMESLSEPELYTHFFDKLSKAVFIEGKTI